jgi:hypothetical protein
MTEALLTIDERKELMWELYDKLAEHLLKLLSESKPGELTASMLAVAASFLRDNEINAKNMGKRSLENGLKQTREDMKLPFTFDS